MTKEEFYNLKVGDMVYYYHAINIRYISTMTASLKRKKIDKIFDDPDGRRRIGFEKGGVLLKGMIHLFDIDRDKLLKQKLLEIKSKIKKEIVQTNDRGCVVIKNKLKTLFQQKNVIKLADKYPELFI